MDAQLGLGVFSLLSLLGSVITFIGGLFITQFILGITGILLMVMSCFFGLFKQDKN